MHEVLRQRLMRRIESLPEEQVYQVLDYIEFLESKYARDLAVESSGLQRFAENLEDRLRKRAMSPATLREAFQLIAAADRVLSSVSSAGRQIISDLGSLGETPDQDADRSGRYRPGAPRHRPPPGGEGAPGPQREGGGGGRSEG
ncbi:MAG TPA: DUF2281 domain-containing protein [Longimicrobiales bacterium]|jgi:hypothetical protein|nr:DUF2281 domain-containing protein [Longimicrobiales bacterium]